VNAAIEQIADVMRRANHTGALIRAIVRAGDVPRAVRRRAGE